MATDFNPAHAAHATTLAATFDSDVRLYDDSFEQLLARTDLPQFDSISLHGIWTWVSSANQALIAEFASRHLINRVGCSTSATTASQAGRRFIH